MSGLLVSVRSADEARAAVSGGASVIDVKEPDRGPLGRADPEIWRAVLHAVPAAIPVSVALGELLEWQEQALIEPKWFQGLAYRKVGLAGCGQLAVETWAEAWARLRRSWGKGPAWVAVIYADWDRANAPPPDDVISVAPSVGCAGILVDTWDKTARSQARFLDEHWLHRVQRLGLFLAVAGGLDAGAIARLMPLRPDLFAVRGAACVGGDRHAAIDALRVTDLARALDRAQGASRIGPVGVHRNTLHSSSVASLSNCFHDPSG
jgi:uncharacterized protein (UPF0264 family)